MAICLLVINSSHLGQNGRHFADDISRRIFWNDKFCISIVISLKFVPKSPIDNHLALSSSPTYICGTRGDGLTFTWMSYECICAGGVHVCVCVSMSISMPAYSYILRIAWLVPDQVICMMTSSNGNIFRVTGHLYGEFTGPRWIPSTKASDAELWCFLWFTPE